MSSAEDIINMSLVTLAKYMFEGDQVAALRDTILLLLKGIASHGVCIPGIEHSSIQENLSRATCALGGDATPHQLATASGSAVQALEQYGRTLTVLLEKQHAEMQQIITMLVQTIAMIQKAKDHSMKSLGEITSDLKKVMNLDDLLNVRARLDVCLQKVEHEALRQAEEGRRAVQVLELGVHQAAELIPRKPPVAELDEEHLPSVAGKPVVEQVQSDRMDPTTGLPNQSCALQAFEEAIAMPGRKYVVTIAMHRAQTLRERFGANASNVLLARLRDDASQLLADSDRLFHWQGSTIVAVLFRNDPIDCVRAEIRRVIDTRRDEMIEIGRRTAIVSVNTSWFVTELVPPVKGVSETINKFAAGQEQRHY